MIRERAALPVRPLAKAIAYGGYFLVATALFIGLRFPGEVVTAAAERACNEHLPQAVWRLASLSLGFPLTLRVTGLEVAPLPAAAATSPALKVARLQLTPRFWPLFLGRYSLAYSAELMQGRATGEITLPMRAPSTVEVSAEVANISLAAGGQPVTVLGRTLRGTISGGLRYRGHLDQVQGEGEANLKLAGGSVTLAAPVFGLSEVQVEQSQLELALHDTEVTVSRGRFRDKDFTGEVTGRLQLNRVLPDSQLQLEGWCELFPSFFATLHLTGGVETFLKQRSKDGKIPFSLHGAVNAPLFTLK